GAVWSCGVRHSIRRQRGAEVGPRRPQPAVNFALAQGEARKMTGARWLGAVLLACAGVAQGQPYPSQPIRLIVPWPPGGGVDTAARIIAQPLGQRLEQSLVIENRPGAAGNIGTELAARAKPDGYSLLMGSVSPNAINVHLYSRLGFDPVKDFAP